MFKQHYFLKLAKFSLVFVLIFSWIFSGWPSFLLKIQETKAATCGAGNGSITFYDDVGGGQCIGVITSGTTFSTPSDWTNTNKIELIGAGGNGANGSGGGPNGRGGSGGGGGAYGVVNNTSSLSASATYDINIGAANANTSLLTTEGTWLCTTNGAGGCANVSDTNVLVGAQSGAAGSGYGSGTNGAGGANGTNKLYNGGAGVASSGNNNSESTGGGGAAGSSGAGQTGSGQTGGNADGATTPPGGAGGTPQGGTGGNGSEWTVNSVTYGSGGGGAGRNAGGGAGGAGGNYGGAGAGGAGSGSSGGAGKQGIIVITYTPAANNPPDQPTNSSPSNGATGVSINPTLTGSTYSDNESDPHSDTEWQVDDDADFLTPVWTRAAGSGEETIVLNSTNGTFANELSGQTKLGFETQYYWQVRYSDGTDWSDWSSATSFTTIALSPPTVAAVTTSNLATSSITLSSNITDNGGEDASEHGFVYGTDPTLNTAATTTLGSFVGTGPFSEDLESLNPGAVYYMRAYAVNSAGTSTLLSIQSVDLTDLVISVSLDVSNFDYGSMPNNTASSTLTLFGGSGIAATNDGNTFLDLTIYGADTSNWTLSGSTGADQYVHQFCNDTDNDCASPPTNYTALTTSSQTLKNNVSASDVVNFQLRVITPDPSSVFTQQSSVVTVQASEP